MKKFRIVLILIGLSIVYFPVYADTLSCNGGLISKGDRDMDVLAKCGKPDLNKQLPRYVEEWTYNFGPQQQMRIIVLRNGVVTEIKTGNYGYPK